MADIDYIALIADRAAGTPGPWRIHHCSSYGDRCQTFYQEVWNDETDILVTTEVTRAHKDGGAANMRRIARLPDLEAAVLALREENQRLQLAVLAAEARGLERAAVVAASDVPKDCGWGPGAGIAVRIRALITPEMRAALEQEQGK